MAEAHPRVNCGIVKAREESQAEMDAAVEISGRSEVDQGLTRPSVN